MSATEVRPRRRWFSKRLLLGVAGAVLVVATFAFLLPTIADYRDVWGLVKELSWGWIAVLLAVTALNLLTFAPPWLVLLPGLRFWPTLMMTQASTALSLVVPGGAAVGMAGAYGMLRQRGFRRSAVARALTLVSVWNQLANLAYPILALFLLTAEGSETAVLTTAAFVGVAILGVAIAALVLVLYSGRMAAEIGELAARGANWARQRLRRGPVDVGWGGVRALPARGRGRLAQALAPPHARHLGREPDRVRRPARLAPRARRHRRMRSRSPRHSPPGRLRASWAAFPSRPEESGSSS